MRWHAEARRVKEGKACGSKQARQVNRFVVLIFFALKPTETAEEQVPETRHALKLHLHTHTRARALTEEKRHSILPAACAELFLAQIENGFGVRMFFFVSLKCQRYALTAGETGTKMARGKRKEEEEAHTFGMRGRNKIENKNKNGCKHFIFPSLHVHSVQSRGDRFSSRSDLEANCQIKFIKYQQATIRLARPAYLWREQLRITSV